MTESLVTGLAVLPGWWLADFEPRLTEPTGSCPEGALRALRRRSVRGDPGGDGIPRAGAAMELP